ncbi:MAG: class I mannose-6-phosphate isomerase [Brockia lithotrophica]|nr:class I mannose-6-phosphate isomerase [Brockia lithotrophica]
MEAYPLRLEPLLVERPWGGTSLAQLFPGAPRRGNGKNLVGEAWILSDHPTHASRIVDGPLAGRTLREFARDFPHAAFGACTSPGPDGRFPLLVKFIEAAEDLSVQVHPDDAYALEHEGDLGKSEAWYFLRTNSAGTVLAGHRFPDRDTYFRAVREGRVRDYLLVAAVRPKTFLYIPAGTVHALLADTVVVEIQEASDVTYRIYDWDRIDPATGKARELHVEKAADVLRFDAAGKIPDVREGDIDTPYFFASRFALPRGERLSLAPASRRCPLVLVGVEGEASVDADGAPVGREFLRKGTTLFLPATLGETTIFAREDAEFLLVEPKSPTRGA